MIEVCRAWGKAYYAVGVPADGLLLGAGGLQLLLEVQRLVVVDALVAELVIIPPKRHWGTRSQLGTFKREIPSAIFTPCPLLSPPLAPKYVRIPNVFTSALNTRLNTRIYLPTPAYFARRVRLGSGFRNLRPIIFL